MQVSSPSPALLDSSMTLHGAKSADPGRKPQKRQSSCQYGLWDLHQARRPGTSGPMIRGAVGCGPKVVASPAQATAMIALLMRWTGATAQALERDVEHGGLARKSTARVG